MYVGMDACSPGQPHSGERHDAGDRHSHSDICERKKVGECPGERRECSCDGCCGEAAFELRPEARRQLRGTVLPGQDVSLCADIFPEPESNSFGRSLLLFKYCPTGS